MNDDCIFNVLLYSNIKTIIDLLTYKLNTEYLWKLLCEREYKYNNINNINNIGSKTWYEKYKLYYHFQKIICKYDLRDYLKNNFDEETKSRNLMWTTFLNRDLDYSVRNALGLLTNCLYNISNLSIYNKQIKFNPTDFVQLINLKKLSLERINITHFANNFNKLTNLETLNIYSCNCKTIPKQIFELYNLKSLSIVDNNLKKLSARIGKLLNLEELCISYNYIDKLPKAILRLLKLKFIDITNMHIKNRSKFKEIGILFTEDVPPLLEYESTDHSDIIELV